MTVDACDASKSENIYALTELGILMIAAFSKKKDWKLVSHPGEIRVCLEW